MLTGCASQTPPDMKLGFAGDEASSEARGRSLFLARLTTQPREDDETAKLSPRVVAFGEPVPKGGGVRKIGDPYVAAGRTVVPKAEPDYDRTGVASWYGALFHGRKTANGEIYDMNALTAAHPTLPLPSYVRVSHMENGRSLLVRVNDRGPFARDRIIDLSKRAAQLLGIKRGGTGPVRVTYLKPAPLSGEDAYELAYLRAQSWYQDGETRLGSAAGALTSASSPRAQRPEDG